MTVAKTSDQDLQAMLRRIGRRVLDEVWISRRMRVFAGVVVVALAGTTAFGWADVDGRSAAATPGIAICVVTLTFFTVTTTLSSISLLRSRFRWCTAAAYSGGLGVVAGLGVVWWHQTTPDTHTPGPSAWMLTGVLYSAVLTVTWLQVILTPLDRSQPDIRVGSPAGR